MTDDKLTDRTSCLPVATELMGNFFAQELSQKNPPYYLVQNEILTSLEKALGILGYTLEGVTLTEIPTSPRWIHHVLIREVNNEFQIKLKMTITNGMWKIRELVYESDSDLIPTTRIIF